MVAVSEVEPVFPTKSLTAAEVAILSSSLNTIAKVLLKSNNILSDDIQEVM